MKEDIIIDMKIKEKKDLFYTTIDKIKNISLSEAMKILHLKYDGKKNGKRRK